MTIPIHANHDRYLTEHMQEWKQRGKCAINKVSNDFFYPHSSAEENKNASYCTGCEVQLECLEFAIVLRESAGVWGGASTNHRERIRKWLSTNAQEGFEPTTVAESSTHLRESLSVYIRDELSKPVRRGRKPRAVTPVTQEEPIGITSSTTGTP